MVRTIVTLPEDIDFKALKVKVMEMLNASR